MTMHVSPAGRAMIEHFEGCVLHAYRDVVGVLTIGYGCTGAAVHAGMTITQEEADRMLSDRLAQEFEPAVNRLIGSAPTTQNQFDAMVSLAFNIGTGGFARSSVLRDHLGQRAFAEKRDFEMWDMADGRPLAALLKRRDAEAALYLTPDNGVLAPVPVDIKVNAASPAPKPPASPAELAVAPPRYRDVPQGTMTDDSEAAAEALNQAELDRL